MIERIIYLPTLRCNCKCKHCGQNQWMESECSPQLVLGRIMESQNIASFLSISGGEPFLKEELAEAVSNLVNNREIYVDFTTNGTCLEQVKRLVELTKYKDRLAFSVSIDGLPKTHNEIRRNPTAFERAIETIKYLRAKNVAVKINTVVQQSNIKELDEFCAYVGKIVPEVEISWIPLISEINGEKDFPYSDNEVSEIYPRFQAEADQSYLETRGKIKLQNCHAGQKTIAIAPDGKVYTCLTGFSYKTLQLREKYMIGDLKSQSMDQVYKVIQSADAKFQNAVRACEGCWNPCEVSNEVNFWGLSIDELKKNVIKKEKEQKKRKLQSKNRRRYTIAVLLLIFYFSLLNIVSHARAPVSYKANTEQPILQASDFQPFFDMGVPSTDSQLPIVNQTANVGAGYAASVSLAGIERIGISFQIECPAEYAGKTIIIDLYNLDANYDAIDQEEYVLLQPGENKVEVQLSPGEYAPESAQLRIFTVETASYMITDLKVFEMIRQPRITGGMMIVIAVVSILLLIMLLIAKYTGKNQ